MRSHLLLSFLFLQLITNCSSPPESAKNNSPVILDDILKLELEFGAENVQDEFLLAKPTGIAVSYKGDIYVSDEDRIKVFDKNGKERSIIGKPGEGPGEFDFTYRSIPKISPTGYISIYDKKGFNLFSPGHDFIKSEKLKNIPKYDTFLDELGLRNLYEEKGCYFNESVKILEGFAYYKDPEDFYTQSHMLWYENGENIEKVTDYKNVKQISVGIVGVNLYFNGTLLWDIMSRDRVVFTHPYFDSVREDQKSSYSLNIYSLSDRKSIKLSNTYTRVEIPDSLEKAFYNTLKEVKEMGSMGTDADIFEIAANQFEDILDETQYFTPLKSLLTDRNHIFAFTHTTNNKGDILADVFDADKEQYTCSAYFDFIPDVIKNGYVYRIGKNDEGFPVIQKYSIDQAVYAKKQGAGPRLQGAGGK
ncbi:6-bladed beta-propeller [candidate division KSB1 bacterium]